MVNFCLLQVLWTVHLTLTLANPISAPVVDLGYVRYRGFRNSTTGYVHTLIILSITTNDRLVPMMAHTSWWCYSLTSYYGIRYAKAPVGQLRWRAPVPVDTHTALRPDILNATVHGPSCIQSTSAWEPSASLVIMEGDEDCLLLDVITPSAPVSANLPVMVQIHGGGSSTPFSILHLYSIYISFTSQFWASASNVLHQVMSEAALQHILATRSFTNPAAISSTSRSNTG
jgi:hypothetical protein